MKKICFILPRYVRHPIGGYKMVFEYANRLSLNQKNEVFILFLNNDALAHKKIPKGVKKILIWYFTVSGPNWFLLNKNIKCISLTQKNWNKKLKNLDKVVATAATTVEYAIKLFPSAKKYYLIQDFENWSLSNKQLYSTYDSKGFTNITVSKWLEEVVSKHTSNPTYYVQNPIDTDSYVINNKIENRNKYTVGMLYHQAKFKGTKYSLNAIYMLKKKYPKLKVFMFGAYPRPRDLPNWINYTQNASKEETINIYNSVGIFINGSVKEGFGLTGLEAMACGATLVSTDYLGVREYAINNFNSLLSPIKDSRKLAKNIDFLFQNDKERIMLAKNGYKTAQKFSWNNAYSKFEKILLQ